MSNEFTVKATIDLHEMDHDDIIELLKLAGYQCIANPEKWVRSRKAFLGKGNRFFNWERTGVRNGTAIEFHSPRISAPNFTLID